MAQFKKGDRVRYAEEYGPWSEWQICKGAEGVVKGVMGDLIDVQFNSTDCIDADEWNWLSRVTPRPLSLWS